MGQSKPIGTPPPVKATTPTEKGPAAPPAKPKPIITDYAAI